MSNTCSVLDEATSCASFPSFAERVVTPFIEVVKQLIQQAQQSTSDTLNQVIAALNSVPNNIRNNSLYTSRMVGAHMQVISDVLASAADPKYPSVTKDNMEIIKYIQTKQPNLFKDMVELGNKIIDEPHENRPYYIIAFAEEKISPIVQKTATTPAKS